MHGAAVFILLSLVAQPIAHLVCEVGCAKTLQASLLSKATASCHEQQRDEEETAALSAGEVLCHDAQGPSTATVADAQKVGATPTVFPSVIPVIQECPARARARCEHLSGPTPPPVDDTTAHLIVRSAARFFNNVSFPVIPCTRILSLRVRTPVSCSVRHSSLLRPWPVRRSRSRRDRPNINIPRRSRSQITRSTTREGMSLFPSRDASGTAWLPETTPMYGLNGQIGAWQLMGHGTVFAQFLYDSGERGSDQLGSINWMMLMARRQAGAGRFGLRGMFSVEPWTIRGCGYPDLLATGEVCNSEVIHDRQHPHDLFMEVAAEYDRPIRGPLRLQLYGGLAGEPALGPVAYPHRLSAAPNPLAPISHHWMDASHITFGVITAGVYTGRWKAETSLFNGREPDEHRRGFDFGPLDSVSGRVWFLPTSNWALQLSAGHLREAEETDGGGSRVDVVESPRPPRFIACSRRKAFGQRHLRGDGTPPTRNRAICCWRKRTSPCASGMRGSAGSRSAASRRTISTCTAATSSSRSRNFRVATPAIWLRGMVSNRDSALKRRRASCRRLSSGPTAVASMLASAHSSRYDPQCNATDQIVGLDRR